jgi:hypothetical protein
MLATQLTPNQRLELVRKNAPLIYLKYICLHPSLKLPEEHIQTEIDPTILPWEEGYNE